jgi:hypothetical protein
MRGRRRAVGSLPVREIVPGITIWSIFSEPIGLDFNGYAISMSSGAILIDPPDPGPEGWDALAELSPNPSI